MRPLFRLALALAVVCLAREARAIEGFTLGFEYARGSWSADPAGIVSGSHGNVGEFPAHGFSGPLTDGGKNGVHLHMGWNILGHALVEGTFQTSFWDAFNSDKRGGVGLAGARVTYFPLEYFLHQPRRPYDVGAELGFGYALGGGNDGFGNAFGMDGKYLSFGLSAEYYLASAFSVSIAWRYFMPFWNQFYFDFNHDVKVPVDDFHAGWNTVNLGVNFHFAAPY